MTNDLISRSKVEEVISALVHEEGVTDDAAVLGCMVWNAVHTMKAVDAAPVVHGRWIPNIREETRAYPPYTYQNGFKCSLCGRVTRSEKEPYCHCGARMDKEEA